MKNINSLKSYISLDIYEPKNIFHDGYENKFI